MSHLAIATLFLRDFTPAISVRITRCLQETGHSLTETRKGRVWILRANEGSLELELTIKPTVDVFFNVEGDLESLKLDLADYPECLSMVSTLGRAEDLEYCSKICERIRALLDCKTRGAELVS